MHDMNSRTDYRKLAHHHRGLYFVTPTREQDLAERFLELGNHAPVQRAFVDVAMGRQLELPRAAGCVALFTFDELCNRPLGAGERCTAARAAAAIYHLVLLNIHCYIHPHARNPMTLPPSHPPHPPHPPPYMQPTTSPLPTPSTRWR